MKRKPKVTKRERKALSLARPIQPSVHAHAASHLHCVACGKHLDASDFEAPATATRVTCQHGSSFPSCVRCASRSTALVAEHDRTNQPVKAAAVWH